MRLAQFEVRNFRSIVKAEKLPFGDLTVLLGPNNEGKSNILQAMVIGMEALSQRRAPRPAGRRNPGRVMGVYDWDKDFPQHLQGSKPEGRTYMRFDFQLTQEETNEFMEEVGSRLNATLPISLSFGPTGRPQFRVLKPRHGAALSAKRDQITKFVGERVDVQYVGAVRTGENASSIVRRMLARELSAATAGNAEYASAVAKLRELQQPVFDAISASVTQMMKGLLPDVLGVTVESASNEDARSLLFPDVQVIVDDGTPTDLVYKGDGVQSLAALAMSQHYSSTTARAREFILVVEEPEAHLHPRAIHGLRDALRQTSKDQQVVITTHSPLFANRLDLASNIVVRKNRAAPAASVEDLRDALGVQAADNLTGAEMVLVVEGETDYRAITALICHRSPRLRLAIEDGIFLVTRLRGTGNLRYQLAQLKDSLSVIHALLDCDEAGREARDAAVAEGVMALGDVTMASRTGAKESELEDLLDPAIYKGSFLEAFGVDVEHRFASQMKKGKWAKRMKLIFADSGADWTEPVERTAKTLVADAVVAAPSLAVANHGEGVLLGLVAALERKLDARMA